MSTAINVICLDRPGMLRDIAGVVAMRGGNIVYTQQFVLERGVNKGKASVYMEIDGPEKEAKGMVEDLEALDSITEVSIHKSFEKIYGSRVIIIGGGAQVAQVAVGAVNEADRHNLRGERISVDTIPLVGEDAIADAVSAVSRLPRASILVLAGALMGGRHHRGGEEASGGGNTRHSLKDGRVSSRSSRPGCDGSHPSRNLRCDACGQYGGIRYHPGKRQRILA